MIETKIVNDLENIQDSDIVYDIDEGILLLKEFIKKTTLHTKEFYKISKKMKGREPESQSKILFKFCKEKLLNQWNYVFATKFFKMDEMKYLKEDIIFNYILGIFISGHSTLPNVKNNLDKILANTLYEISQRSLDERQKEV